MRRGKHLFRVSEFNEGMPREAVVDPEVGNTICRFDAATPWFGESHSPAREYSGSQESQSEDEAGDVVAQGEDHGDRKPGQTLPKISTHYRISSLKKTKIKLRGKISELFSPRPTRAVVRQAAKTPSAEERAAKEATRPLPTETVVREPAASAIEQVEARPPDVIVKVLPTPVKRHRSPKIELVSQPAKPLKVIRRRREEAPKVFETAPKDFPKSMLEGIKDHYKEETDSQRK